MRNNDIVVRLRLWGDSYHLHKESADEIERLRAENATLREAIDDLEQEMRHLENLVQAAKDDGWSGGYSG